MKTRLLALLALVPAAAVAWVDEGHMVIVAIAWEDLTPHVQARVRALVALAPEERFRDPLSASTWPDYDPDRARRPWHYTNIHFREDGRATANRPAKENVVWAIQQLEGRLAERRLDEKSRADALIHVLHFVGDIHQPLHTMARDTTAFPRGDRGGNEFKFKPIEGISTRGPVDNLHLLWDFGGGLLENVSIPPDAKQEYDLRALARQIRKEHPRGSLANVSEADPMRWAEEGFGLRRLVYRLEEGREVPSTYLGTIKVESAKRLAFAGYRLADLLNRALKE